jgi:putative endonuclease
MKEMHYVYILYSETGRRRYVGMTADAEQRLAMHNAGKVRSTKAYRPWRRIWLEEYQSIEEARKRELYLKTGSGRKWMDENVKI